MSVVSYTRRSRVYCLAGSRKISILIDLNDAIFTKPSHKNAATQFDLHVSTWAVHVKEEHGRQLEFWLIGCMPHPSRISIMKPYQNVRVAPRTSGGEQQDLHRQSLIDFEWSWYSCEFIGREQSGLASTYLSHRLISLCVRPPFATPIGNKGEKKTRRHCSTMFSITEQICLEREGFVIDIIDARSKLSFLRDERGIAMRWWKNRQESSV